MKTSHDKLHRDLAYQVGDWVWLRLHHRTATGITDNSRSKLSPRFYGPFQILERVGSVAYRLRLPAKARIHDVFHVVYLKKHQGDLPAAMGSLPPIEHGRALPVPAKVLRAFSSGQSWKILVQWEGRPAMEATWELLQDFKLRYPHFKLKDELFCQGREVLWNLALGRSSYAGIKESHPQLAIYCLGIFVGFFMRRP